MIVDDGSWVVLATIEAGYHSLGEGNFDVACELHHGLSRNDPFMGGARDARYNNSEFGPAQAVISLNGGAFVTSGSSHFVSLWCQGPRRILASEPLSPAHAQMVGLQVGGFS
jgi:hypothetical protein